MKQKIIILVLVAGFICVSACGRISKPDKPKGSLYPKEYTVKP